jgi:hypothetical protein
MRSKLSSNAGSPAASTFGDGGAVEFGHATAGHPLLPPADHTTSATTATVVNT